LWKAGTVLGGLMVVLFGAFWPLHRLGGVFGGFALTAAEVVGGGGGGCRSESPWAGRKPARYLGVIFIFLTL